MAPRLGVDGSRPLHSGSVGRRQEVQRREEPGKGLSPTMEAPGGRAGQGEGQGCRPLPGGTGEFLERRGARPSVGAGRGGQPSRRVLGPQQAGAGDGPGREARAGAEPRPLESGSLGPRGSSEAGAASAGPGPPQRLASPAGNMDRHHYEMFTRFGEDGFLVHLDNARG